MTSRAYPGKNKLGDQEQKKTKLYLASTWNSTKRVICHLKVVTADVPGDDSMFHGKNERFFRA